MIRPQHHERLTFESESHTYRLGGLIVPSVTQIMRPLSETVYRDIDGDTLGIAARRGTAVHTAIEFHANYGIDDCPDSVRGYFDGYLKWREAWGPDIKSTEMSVWHSTLRYAGTVDMLAFMGDKMTLIDIKTTAAHNPMLTSVQLEAYRQALESHGQAIDQVAVLYLRKDGTYQFKIQKADPEAWKTFAALMVVSAHIKKYERS